MLGVVHQGVAFPWYGYWTSRVIPTGADQKLFQQFLQYFPERQIACLTADRGLLKEWFCYLQAKPHTPLYPYPRELQTG